MDIWDSPFFPEVPVSSGTPAVSHDISLARGSSGLFAQPNRINTMAMTSELAKKSSCGQKGGHDLQLGGSASVSTNLSDIPFGYSVRSPLPSDNLMSLRVGAFSSPGLDIFKNLEPHISLKEDDQFHQNKTIHHSGPPQGNSFTKSSSDLPYLGGGPNNPVLAELVTPSILGSVGGNPLSQDNLFNLNSSSLPVLDLNSVETGPVTPSTVFGFQSPALPGQDLPERVGSLCHNWSGINVHPCALTDRQGSPPTLCPCWPWNCNHGCGLVGPLEASCPCSGNCLPGCSLIGPLASLETLHPCLPENSLHGMYLQVQQKTIAKRKAALATLMRRARKKKMTRNRKASSHPVATSGTRSSRSAGAPSGSSSQLDSSRAIINTLRRCETFLSLEGEPGIKDRQDQNRLQFLLKKVLTPSDVSNIGRILLPKRSAESHLPHLDEKRGIEFTCEDFDTGEKMVLRYKFWANNKSRMYVLENVGDFVKKHKLKEYDVLIVYRSLKGTYIIRGWKVGDDLDEVTQDAVEPEFKEVSRTNFVEVDSQGEVNRKYGVEVEIEDKEASKQKSLLGRLCYGASSNQKKMQISETTVCVSGLESEPGVPTVTSLGGHQDDLLNLLMGDSSENFLRFPRLEQFDI